MPNVCLPKDVERISLVGTTILISLLGRKSNFSTKLTDLSSAKVRNICEFVATINRTKDITISTFLLFV